MKKIILITTVVVMGIAILIGCSAKTDSKEITVYTAMEMELVDKYLESFKAIHPDIHVKIVRDSTGIIVEKLLEEGFNTPADLMWGVTASSLLGIRGFLEPYTPKGVENVLPLFKDDANPPIWVGMNAWEVAIIYNKDEARKKHLPPIKSYQDLLKPEFKGEIIMSNPSSSGTAFFFVSGLIQLMGEEKAFEYLDELHKNIAIYTYSGSAPAKRAGSGEFSVGITSGSAAVAQRNNAAPVEIIFPAEGSGWDVEANALIKRGKVKKEAKIFLDWAISMDFMTLLHKDHPITSIKVNDEIPAGYIKNPLSQLIPNNDIKLAAKNKKGIIRKWISKYDSKTEGK